MVLRVLGFLQAVVEVVEVRQGQVRTARLERTVRLEQVGLVERVVQGLLLEVRVEPAEPRAVPE